MHNQVSMNQQQIEWRVIEATVQGATHVRGGMPNQDAIQSWPKTIPRTHLVIAIADGHGSRNCYRSDRGSKIAVQVAVETAKEFFSYFPEENLSRGSLLKQLLIRGLLNRWKEHLDNNLTEMLSSRLIQAESVFFPLKDSTVEYLSNRSQNEFFNKQERNQLRNLATQVIENYLHHQPLSMKLLLYSKLQEDLFADLTRAFQDASCLKSIADRASQEIWRRSLIRYYEKIFDDSLNQKAVDDKRWQNLKDLTSRFPMQIKKMSSTFVGDLIKCLCQTWEDAFRGASVIEHIGGQWLTIRIVEKWSEAVMRDIEKDPISENNFEELRANPLLAYGSTLLTVMITKYFILYLQLGDGDILTVSETGEVTRPIDKNMDLIANETYSLCLPDAWRLFRLSVKPLSDPLPALIMLSTDGYSNSYETEEDFIKVARDILQIARTEGEAAIRKNIEMWLKETTEIASGDDISLGVIFRQDIFKLRGEISEPFYDGSTDIETLRDPDKIQKPYTIAKD